MTKAPRNILLATAALVALALCAHLIREHRWGEGAAFVVEMSEKGFSPSSIEVPQGAVVTFKNAGTEAHWPASDSHPSHTLFDGTPLEVHCAEGATAAFDSCGPIEGGASWSFSFDVPGTYGYHDHLWPQFSGTIRVIGTATLYSEESDARFYLEAADRYVGLARSSDPRAAIDALEQASKDDPRTSAFCHDILHAVGKASYEEYGGFADAVVFQKDFCNSGYIHGLIEAYFQSDADPLGNLGGLCQSAHASPTPFESWQCNHGIGHGFMYFTGGDLDKSLKLCGDNLPWGADSACRNGAYMEVFNSERLAKEGSFVADGDPLSTCAKQSRDKRDCYGYVPTYYAQTPGIGLSDMFAKCRAAGYDEGLACIEGIGSETMKRNMGDVEGVFALCDLAGSRAERTACARGAVGIYMNQNGSYSSGIELCPIVPQAYKELCDETVEARYSFFGGR